MTHAQAKEAEKQNKPVKANRDIFWMAGFPRIPKGTLGQVMKVTDTKVYVVFNTNRAKTAVWVLATEIERIEK